MLISERVPVQNLDGRPGSFFQKFAALVTDLKNRENKLTVTTVMTSCSRQSTNPIQILHQIIVHNVKFTMLCIVHNPQMLRLQRPAKTRNVNLQDPETYSLLTFV